MFSGPTGVGKTELAKQLAEHINMNLVRIDMSEYMEKHAVSKLIGTPPGYVGFEQGGVLTDEVDKNPYSVVLIDEIEKADPEIFNILLQVMDYGQLTDHNSKKINFRNSIIIITSNVGAMDFSKNSIGFNNVIDHKHIAENAIRNSFKPEFINRLDAVIAFQPLNQEMIKNIVDKFITQLQVQLLNKKIEVNLSEQAANFIAVNGFDLIHGARPLERFIDKKIKVDLADEILFGKLTKGGKVMIDCANDNLILNVV
jgi:ATP-dependent Clp protease ATP-binding subunit ClpA